MITKVCLAVLFAVTHWLCGLPPAVAQQSNDPPVDPWIRTGVGWDEAIILPGDRVTIKSRRLPPPPAYKPRFPFPEPQQEDTSVSQQTYDIAGMRAVVLKGIVTTRHTIAEARDGSDRRFAPMVLSPDGRWLYVLDGLNVIRKLNAITLEPEATLVTQADCSDIACSKEGLLVGVRSLLAFWVLDGDTLRVKREVPAGRINCVAASPVSNIGYCAGDRGLHVVDLRLGEPLYFIEAMRLPGARITHYYTFDGFISAMSASADGKHLFAGSDGKIHRLRIENDQLYLEESTDKMASLGMPTYFCFNGNGDWIAIPSERFKVGRTLGIPIYEQHNLYRPFLKIETGSVPLAVGFDPRTSNIYAPVDHKIHVFGPRGEKLRTLKSPLTAVRRILVHPAGERVFVWSDQGLTVLDMKQADLNPNGNDPEP